VVGFGTGGLTIHDDGLKTIGGITAVSGGMKVNGGGLTIQSDGASLTGGLTVRDIGVRIDDGLTIVSDGAAITGGLTVHNTGATIGGGANINGGLTVTGTGLSITAGGQKITGGLTVSTGGLLVTAGVSVNNDGIKVTSGGIHTSGGLTIHTNGLKTSGGVTLNDGGLMITNGGVTVNNGNVLISGGVTVDGNLYATALYNPTLVADSDRRLKTNIKPLLNPLEKISKLQGIYFSWKQEGEFEKYNYDEKRHVGLIAQNVHEVLPEVVETIHDDEHLAIRQLELIPLLVEGIRELDNRTSTKDITVQSKSNTADVISRRYDYNVDIDWEDENEEIFEEINSLEHASSHIRQLYHINRKLLEKNSFLFSRMESLEKDHQALVLKFHSMNAKSAQQIFN